MNFDSIVFDLDGTLWDTSEACAVSWNRVVARAAIPFRAIVADDVRRVTGKPHDECIRVTFAGLWEPQLQHLIEETQTEDNRSIDELGGYIYPGVAEGLALLSNRYPLFIVSNCQAGYIETFFRFSKLGYLFKDYECWGRTGRSKSENLKSLIARNHLAAPLMVGDAQGDQQAARDSGIPFLFAEYGFGASIDPDYSAGSFPQLVSYLLLSV